MATLKGKTGTLKFVPKSDTKVTPKAKVFFMQKSTGRVNPKRVA